jgi:peptidoglycan DL-endopeptidase CwlO
VRRECPKTPDFLRSPRKRQAHPLVVVLTLSLLAAPAATAQQSVSSKQAEARRVLAQIQQIDASMEHAVEAYDAATYKLGKIETAQRENRHDLVVARSNLERAQEALSRRLVQMYTSGDDMSGIGVLLGATSLSDFLGRVDAEASVSSQDAQIVLEVTSFKAAVKRHEQALRRAHAAQASVVQQRAAQKARIASQLAQRRALLSTIRSQIARIQAAERARQVQIANQARARIASQPAPDTSGSVVGASVSTPETTVAAPSTHGGVVGIAMRYLGVPYRWGGASPSGFDCSGLVMYVYAQVGVSLPHSSYAQYGAGVPVSRSQLQPGDLVFFNGLGHVGIYIGGNQMIHAPHTGDVVKISSLTGWYASEYVGARRIP